MKALYSYKYKDNFNVMNNYSEEEEPI